MLQPDSVLIEFKYRALSSNVVHNSRPGSPGSREAGVVTIRERGVTINKYLDP